MLTSSPEDTTAIAESAPGLTAFERGKQQVAELREVREAQEFSAGAFWAAVTVAKPWKP